jgi:hypothetical protein
MPASYQLVHGTSASKGNKPTTYAKAVPNAGDRNEPPKDSRENQGEANAYLDFD